MTDFDHFLRWEAHTRDTIDFKKIYVDMAGDLNAGLMLSEIIYWYLPAKGSGENKLRVHRDEFDWVAVRRYQWWERTRLTPDQADRALGILVKAGLMVKARYKFGNEVTVHVRIQEARFMELWQELSENPPVNPYAPAEMEFAKKAKSNLPKVENGIGTKGKILYTETTSETTSEIDEAAAATAADLDAAKIFSLYSENIALIVPLIAEEIKEALATFPAIWIEDAIREAAKNHARSWKYVRAILERWQKDGRQAVKPQNKRSAAEPAAPERSSGAVDGREVFKKKEKP